MSDSRRIFGGFYKRYDGKFFVVVTTATDYETGEEKLRELSRVTRLSKSKVIRLLITMTKLK